jgi:uridine kinase
VAIDGRGGSGKSTLADFLAGRVPGCKIVRTDDFARPGVPGWDWPRFLGEVARPLLGGKAGRYMRFDWDEGSLTEWHEVPGSGVVILEGVSSMRRELELPWDLTIWVETPQEIRLARGVARDGEAMRPQWEQVWEPQEDRYVADQKPHLRADLVVSGSGL